MAKRGEIMKKGKKFEKRLAEAQDHLQKIKDKIEPFSGKKKFTRESPIEEWRFSQ